MLKQDYVNETFKLIAILENSWDFIFSKVWLTVKTYSILHLISVWVNTSKDLLNWTYWSKPNMAKKLKFLEENWFVDRKIDEFDKRVFRFFHTKKAKNALQIVSPIYENSINIIFDWIDFKDLEISFSVVRKALDNLWKCTK